MSQQEVDVADDPSKEGGEAPRKSRSTNGTGDDESLAVRVDHLEAKFEQYIQNYLEDAVREMLQDHDERLGEVEKVLQSIDELAEGQQSSPEKRSVDLAMALIRRARARSDDDRYAMWWRQVQDALADMGHGPPVHKPWCFDAMEDVSTGTGFGKTTIRNPDGREVQAVRVRLDELPSEERSTVSNDITTGKGGKAAESSPSQHPNQPKQE